MLHFFLLVYIIYHLNVYIKQMKKKNLYLYHKYYLLMLILNFLLLNILLIYIFFRYLYIGFDLCNFQDKNLYFQLYNFLFLKMIHLEKSPLYHFHINLNYLYFLYLLLLIFLVRFLLFFEIYHTVFFEILILDYIVHFLKNFNP